VIPLFEKGDKIWKAWDLLPNPPQHEEQKLDAYNEPSVSELEAMMNDRPLQ